MNTPQGRDAAKILTWVNADPAGRAAQGLAKMTPLAVACPTTRALREVEDVTRVIGRLVPP